MSTSMALAAHKTPTQGFCAIHASQCAARGGVEKMVAYIPVGNMSRGTAFNHLSLSSVCRMAAGPVYRGKMQCFRVFAFRDVTKKDDSSGAEDPESETPQISLSSYWQGIQDIKASSFQTLCSFPDWLSKLQEQKLILRANEILQRPIARLKSLEGDQIVTELQDDKFGHHILKFWQNSELWVKLSLAIFPPWCFYITVVYGIEASSDLLPLWLIGPLFMAALFKLSVAFYHNCIQTASNIMTTGRQISMKFLKAIHNRILAVQALLARWIEHIVWFLSGKYMEILKAKFHEYMMQKINEFDKYIDSRWLEWRRVKKVIRKLL